MIWHEADITSQLLCIGVSVCRPLYKDWLNNVVVKIGSTTGSALRSKSTGVGSGFSVIALQTVGGSSVVPKSSRKDSIMDMDGGGGVVKVERSWRVESDSRSVVFPADDSASEEYILGSAGAAGADSEQPHQD